MEYHSTSILLKVIRCVISVIVDISTVVIVNCLFLFTAGTSQIIIGTKSLLDRLFVSLIPRLQIMMGMETDLFLSCGMLCFSAQVARYTWMSIIEILMIIYVEKLVAYIYYL